MDIFKMFYHQHEVRLTEEMCEDGQSGVSALVSRLNSSNMESKGVNEPSSCGTPNSDSRYKNLYSTFPRLKAFQSLCHTYVGVRNIHVLENLVVEYIKVSSGEVRDCWTKPNRAAKLKKCLVDAIIFFHFFYQDVKDNLEHSVYLDKMSDLVTMYMDMEIRSSKRGKEIPKKIAARITSILHTCLDRSEDHILDTVLQCQSFSKEYKDVCIPILSKLLSDVQPVTRHELLYVRLLLALKLWKTVVRDIEQRKHLNKLASDKLPAPVSLLSRPKILANVLPKIPKKKKNITLFLMVSKFNLRDACQAFIKCVRATQHDFSTVASPVLDDTPYLSSISSNGTEQLIKVECEGGSSALLNGIWSSLSVHDLSDSCGMSDIMIPSPAAPVPSSATDTRKRKSEEEGGKKKKKKKRRKRDGSADDSTERRYRRNELDGKIRQIKTEIVIKKEPVETPFPVTIKTETDCITPSPTASFTIPSPLPPSPSCTPDPVLTSSPHPSISPPTPPPPPDDDDPSPPQPPECHSEIDGYTVHIPSPQPPPPPTTIEVAPEQEPHVSEQVAPPPQFTQVTTAAPQEQFIAIPEPEEDIISSLDPVVTTVVASSISSYVQSSSPMSSPVRAAVKLEPEQRSQDDIDMEEDIKVFDKPLLQQKYLPTQYNDLHEDVFAELFDKGYSEVLRPNIQHKEPKCDTVSISSMDDISTLDDYFLISDPCLNETFNMSADHIMLEIDEDDMNWLDNSPTKKIVENASPTQEETILSREETVLSRNSTDVSEKYGSPASMITPNSPESSVGLQVPTVQQEITTIDDIPLLDTLCDMEKVIPETILQIEEELSRKRCSAVRERSKSPEKIKSRRDKRSSEHRKSDHRKSLDKISEPNCLEQVKKQDRKSEVVKKSSEHTATSKERLSSKHSPIKSSREHHSKSDRSKMERISPSKTERRSSGKSERKSDHRSKEVDYSEDVDHIREHRSKDDQNKDRESSKVCASKTDDHVSNVRSSSKVSNTDVRKSNKTDDRGKSQVSSKVENGDRNKSSHKTDRNKRSDRSKAKYRDLSPPVLSKQQVTIVTSSADCMPDINDRVPGTPDCVGSESPDYNDRPCTPMSPRPITPDIRERLSPVLDTRSPRPITPDISERPSPNNASKLDSVTVVKCTETVLEPVLDTRPGTSSASSFKSGGLFFNSLNLDSISQIAHVNAQAKLNKARSEDYDFLGAYSTTTTTSQAYKGKLLKGKKVHSSPMSGKFSTKHKSVINGKVKKKEEIVAKGDSEYLPSIQVRRKSSKADKNHITRRVVKEVYNSGSLEDSFDFV